MRGPYGKFIWTEEVSEKLFLLGAGSGITPLKAMLEYIYDKKLDTPVKLLYTCRHGDNVIFKDELEKLTQSIKNCFYELTLTREPADKYPGTRKGRINEEYLREQVKGFEKANFYLCGAPGFVNAIIDLLVKVGIDRDRIKREQWG